MSPTKKHTRKKHPVRQQEATKKLPAISTTSSIQQQRLIDPDSIQGVDDMGDYYSSHAALLRLQTTRRSEFYAANDQFWASGGYGGKTDDETMIGDSDGDQDGVEGLAFLDRYLAGKTTASTNNGKKGTNTTRKGSSIAIDLGAGVGRITKGILLKRYDNIRLVEGNLAISKQSKTYLGRKRAARCVFSNCRLENISSQDVAGWGEPADLMWIQWTLQYLTDQDVISSLRTLAGGLRSGTGVLVVKENRPFGNARENRFQIDTPQGGNKRYDITRPDDHHRYLFQMAGFTVDSAERGVETNTYALTIDN